MWSSTCSHLGDGGIRGKHSQRSGSLYFEMGLGGKTGKGGGMGTFVSFKVGVGKGKESWPGVNRTCRGVTAVVVVEVGDGGMRTRCSRRGNSPVSVREG
jgi:hypothetical protein